MILFAILLKKIIYQLLWWKILILYSEKNQQKYCHCVCNVFWCHPLLASGRS